MSEQTRPGGISLAQDAVQSFSLQSQPSMFEAALIALAASGHDSQMPQLGSYGVCGDCFSRVFSSTVQFFGRST